MRKNRRNPMNLALSRRGSVLMEFVLVLPLYIAAMGGILLMGLRSLDTINLRSADLWNIFEGGGRFSGRIPALAALQDMFPRTSIITSERKLSLQNEKSYLKAISGKVQITLTEDNFLRDWLNAPYVAQGETPQFVLPITIISTSRYEHPYSRLAVMRSEGSKSSKRHWSPGRLADKEIWEFDSHEDDYPKEWNWKGLEKAASGNDKFTEDPEPEKKIEFYERFGRFEKWSEKDE